jgi:hypothetical protein
MTAYDYYQKYQRQSLGSTLATRKASAEDKRQATGSDAVDFHVTQQTTKE